MIELEVGLIGALTNSTMSIKHDIESIIALGYVTLLA